MLPAKARRLPTITIRRRSQHRFTRRILRTAITYSLSLPRSRTILPSLRPIRTLIRGKLRRNENNRFHKIRSGSLTSNEHSYPASHNIKLPRSRPNNKNRFLRRRNHLRTTRVIILNTRRNRNPHRSNNPRTTKIAQTTISTQCHRNLRRSRIVILNNITRRRRPSTHQLRGFSRTRPGTLRPTRSRISRPFP